MKKMIYYVLLFVVVLQSCDNSASKRDIGNIPIIDLNSFETETIFWLDDLIDSVRFVSLETNKDNIIGAISKLVIKNDTIYVFDKKHTKSLFLFTIDGKYLFKISNFGKGPGEYIDFEDFIVSSKFIEIYDSRQGKIIYYDKSGNFNNEITIGFFGLSFYKSNDNYLFYSEGFDTKYDERGKYGLINIDSKGNLIKKMYRHNIRYSNKHTFTKHFVFHDDNIFLPNYSNFIYKIDNNSINEIYRINRGKYGFELSNLTDEIIFSAKENAIYNIDNVLIVDKYIYLDFLFQFYGAYALYNIDNMELIKSGVGLMPSSKTKGLWYIPKTTYNNNFVSIISEEEIRGQIETTELCHDDFFKQYVDMPYFNPVLMFYNLK